METKLGFSDKTVIYLAFVTQVVMSAEIAAQK